MYNLSYIGILAPWLNTQNDIIANTDMDASLRPLCNNMASI